MQIFDLKVDRHSNWHGQKRSLSVPQKKYSKTYKESNEQNFIFYEYFLGWAMGSGINHYE